MDVQAEAIKAIYDAALTSDRWGRALDHMVDATAAKSTMLYDMSLVDGPAYALSTTSRVIRKKGDAVDRYNKMIAGGGGSGFDEDGLRLVHSRPALTALFDDEIFDPDDYPTRPEVIWTKKELGIFRRVAISLADDPKNVSGLLFQYDLAMPSVPPGDRARIETLAIHAAKAIGLYKLTHPLRLKYRAVLSVLDMIDLPILLFSGDGTVILKNRAAGDVLSARDALWLDRTGEMRARDETAGAAVTDAVHRMARTARGEGGDASVEIEVPRGDKAPPVYALISPLRDAEMELEAGLDGALMTLIDPTYPTRARVDILGAAYGLTPAETRVGELIASGQSNVEIAELTGVSPETVKTQVAAIFSKTGCRGRLSFLWRVFQFSPPVR